MIRMKSLYILPIFIFYFLLNFVNSNKNNKEGNIDMTVVKLINGNSTYNVFHNNSLEELFKFRKDYDICDCSPKQIFYDVNVYVFLFLIFCASCVFYVFYVF